MLMIDPPGFSSINGRAARVIAAPEHVSLHHHFPILIFAFRNGVQPQRAPGVVDENVEPAIPEVPSAILARAIP